MKHTARGVMTKGLLTINWEESLKAAYSIMAKKSFRHLPVTDDRKEIVGMISDRDLLKAMNSRVSIEDFFRAEEVTFDSHVKVKDYMSWPVISTEIDTDIRVVIKEILTKKISCVLIVENHAAVGIITTEDLLKVLYELLDDKGTPRINLSSLRDLESLGFWSQAN